MAFTKRNGKLEERPQTVRQSQLVTTFGPGSMVDLVNDAVMLGGLDFWSQGTPIEEPRLRAAIVDRFRQLNRALSQDTPFRAPPEGDDNEATRHVGVQVLEFPHWFVCQGCHALLHSKHAMDLSGGRYVHQCDQKKKSECVPVRFVSACKRGHIDDFPWIALVHEMEGNARCDSPSLFFEEGATGDFNDIFISCGSCGGRAKLNKVMSGVKIRCRGERPWLGSEGREECDEEQTRLLVRTASNSYFSQVMSALSIEDPARRLDEKVRSVWDVLKNTTPELLPAFKQIEKVRIALVGFKDSEVLEAIEAIKADRQITSGPLRTAEFKQLVSQPLEAAGDIARIDDKFFARTAKLSEPLPEGVARVVLASKLREVIAQVGFTRLEAVSPDIQGEYDLGVKTAALGLTTNWLPAAEIRGEGVFVQLDEMAVRAWEARDEVKARERELMAGYEAWSKSAEDAPPFPGVRFYLLHSLSHLLMSAISLECGYAASSIRERIYCGPSEKDPTPMAAILVSTGTSGTEGTLGGLVEQGRQIRAHLARAWDLGRLCSNDPVCSTHTPNRDHAERFLEGAACHGCLFVAECSCERFNRYLDRALVVPSIGHSADLAFFSKRP